MIIYSTFYSINKACCLLIDDAHCKRLEKNGSIAIEVTDLVPAMKRNILL